MKHIRSNWVLWQGRWWKTGVSFDKRGWASPCLSIIVMCISSSAFSHLINLEGLKLTQNTYSSLLTHTKQLSLIIFCEMAVGIVFRHTHRHMSGWTDRHVSWNVYLDVCQWQNLIESKLKSMAWLMKNQPFHKKEIYKIICITQKLIRYIRHPCNSLSSSWQHKKLVEFCRSPVTKVDFT